MIEIEQGRKEEIEKNTIKDLEEIEKLIYYRFQRMIDELKLTQEKYRNENTKLYNELVLVRKEKSEMQIKMKELTARLKSLRFNIGETNDVYLD